MRTGAVGCYNKSSMAPKIYSDLASAYKAKMDSNSQRKSTTVKGTEWSLLLGKDALPSSLLHSRMYSRSSTAVMLKVQGTYHVWTQNSNIATAPGLQSAAQKELGLAFGKAEFLPHWPTRQQNRQAGAKRGPSASQPGEPNAAQPKLWSAVLHEIMVVLHQGQRDASTAE